MTQSPPANRVFADKSATGGHVLESENSERSSRPFFETDEVQRLIRRGALYLEAGVPIHLSGAAGIGKTALALRIAAEIGRPVSLMTGHDSLTPEDFVGREVGHSESVVVDRYIQSVHRKETQSRVDWRDAILTVAMERGYTLIYDEFTRASPQANVALLSVLEEGLLVSSNGSAGRSYIRAHPDFRIILTSNPSDYVAVNAAPDALLDRLITFNLTGYSAETEAGVVETTTGLGPDCAIRIVSIVRELREVSGAAILPSMRTSLMIGRIVAHKSRQGEPNDDVLTGIVTDVVCGRSPKLDPSLIRRIVRERPGPTKKVN